MNRLRFVSLLSAIYDGAIGILLLAGRPLLARLFEVPLPQPPIHADLNGILLLAIAAGYSIPYRDPERGRSYLWIMGPLLKGTGALAFVLDFVIRHSPASFLIFAASDGAVAALTLWALTTESRVEGRASRVTSRESGR